MQHRTFAIRKNGYFFAIVFLAILIITGIDIINDLQEGLSFEHISHEIGIALLCLIPMLYQFRIIRKKISKLDNLQNRIEQMTQENLQIKDQLKKLSGDFQQIIQVQMNQWKLSEGEKDIGKLIMKGLNMREIAQIRNTSESTVRQQATSIYKKANVHGRQEFIAYFLEDL